jgi:hypothetical protein
MRRTFAKSIGAAVLLGMVTTINAWAQDWERGGGYGSGGSGQDDYGGHWSGGYWGGGGERGLMNGGSNAGSLDVKPGYYGGYPSGYGSYNYHESTRCYFTRQPKFDAWGNIVRYQGIRVCD